MDPRVAGRIDDWVDRVVAAIDRNTKATLLMVQAQIASDDVPVELNAMIQPAALDLLREVHTHA